MPARLRGFGIGLAALAVALAGPTSGADGRLTLKDKGFASPSAVRHEPQGDRYLVSNINGPALARDNNGFISRLSPEGEVQALRWIAGGRNGVTLNAPKGMALDAGRLYVADIDVVRVFDAASGAPVRTIAIPGAIALTDVAAAGDGRLLVSDIGRDMATGAIFQVDASGKASVLARGDHLLRPTALAIRPDRKIVYAPLVGEIVLLMGTDGEITDLRDYPSIKLPYWPARALGRLSGVVLLDGETPLVASKEAGTVARVRFVGPSTLTQVVPVDPKAREALGINGEGRGREFFSRVGAPDSEFIIRDVTDPGRIGLDRKRSRILVPEVSTNAVVIAPLPAASAQVQAGN